MNFYRRVRNGYRTLSSVLTIGATVCCPPLSVGLTAGRLDSVGVISVSEPDGVETVGVIKDWVEDTSVGVDIVGVTNVVVGRVVGVTVVSTVLSATVVGDETLDSAVVVDVTTSLVVPMGPVGPVVSDKEVVSCRLSQSAEGRKSPFGQYFKSRPHPVNAPVGYPRFSFSFMTNMTRSTVNQCEMFSTHCPSGRRPAQQQ